MDPDECLKRLREKATLILLTDDTAVAAEHAFDLACLAQSLDEWIGGGGFLPHDWREQARGSRLRVVVPHDPEVGR